MKTLFLMNDQFYDILLNKFNKKLDFEFSNKLDRKLNNELYLTIWHELDLDVMYNMFNQRTNSAF
jgi:hypothetical protein